MDNVARVTLGGRRYQVCTRSVRIVGVDLTGASFRMEVRLAPNTPGIPLVALGTVTTGAAEGVRLIGVETVDGKPVSTLGLRVNKSTMEAMPFTGELGDDSVFAYDLMVTPAGGVEQAWLAGDFVVQAGVTGATNAPGLYGAGGSMQRASLSGDTAMAVFGTTLVQVTIGGGQGPRGEASGPLGAGSVGAEEIADDPGEQRAIADKLVVRPEPTSQASGTEVLGAVTTGVRNWGSGFQALKSVTTANENTAGGFRALASVTGGADPLANYNTAFGSFAGQNITIGYKNALFGRAAGDNLTAGYHNLAAGYGSFHWATTAVNCVALGFEAVHGGDGSTLLTAQGIVGVGFQSLYSCLADFNVAVGTSAGRNIKTGARNSILGTNGLNTLVTGSDNFAGGYGAGFSHTGSGSIFIGAGADASAGLSNVTVIGTAMTAKDSNTLLLGNGQTVLPGTTAADIGSQAKPWGFGIFGKSVYAHSGTAPAAGGTTGAGLLLSSTPNLGVSFGSGAPTLSAARGSLYLRTDGSGPGNRMYVNADNGTGWTPVTTAA